MITGNRTRVDFGNGTWQTFSYGTDARYMSTGIDYAYKCDTNDTLGNKGGIRITRTNGGNPLSWADNTDKFIKTFSYDSQGRLANADIPGMSRTDYGYDWVGNRTSPTAVYNDADQLTSYGGNTYNYNTYGDMTSGAGRTYTPGDNGKVWRIAYNSVNYDNYFTPMGYRYTSTAGAVSTNYVYDVTAGIPAVVAEANGGTVTNYYVREPGGELVMRKNGTDQKYYHFDELGSTLFLTNASGIQTDKYVYNAWGKVVSSAGSTVNPYRYVGRLGYYSDAGTGLLLLGARLYDPEAGVFTQRDEEQDGLSYYAYTSGQPMVAVDPGGNVKWRVVNPRWWAYDHAYISFDKIKCKGRRSWGYMPSGITTEDDCGKTQRYNDHPSTPETRQETKESNDNVLFEMYMCDCISDSMKDTKRPPWDAGPCAAKKGFPGRHEDGNKFYVCGSWVRDMWNCANRKYKEYQKCLSDIESGKTSSCGDKMPKWPFYN